MKNASTKTSITVGVRPVHFSVGFLSIQVERRYPHNFGMCLCFIIFDRISDTSKTQVTLFASTIIIFLNIFIPSIYTI